ncbi:CotH kinase family protein [Alkalibaculum bacchi]|uniref:CotH kinase family protein n=1 Tax=Alkalibaculum bacchi TaxID=645887 RepID=UPI0026EE12AE|nr:CotH kinase family protein [Alkalibaculum bacchi]
MKKKISVLLALFLFITVIGVGSLKYKEIESTKIKENSSTKKGKVSEWKKPDIENLEYYGLDAFDTNFPVVHIDTNEQRIGKENKIWATISVLNGSLEGAKRSICDVPDYKSLAAINLRGASSYSVFDKEQYRIKFYKNQRKLGSKEYEFLGMGPHSEWVLNGPFLDRTLLRNRVIYQVSREVFEWAPDSRFCEVFVNGEYRGIYLAIEPITTGETRLQLSDFGLLSGETAYIVKRDREGTEADFLNNYGKISGKTSNDLTISYPGKNSITTIQRQWIEKDISNFEEVLYSDRFDDPANGYSKYMDVDNFVDYFILNEVVMNNDAGNLSTYVYKEINGKLKLVVWDFNNAYNNYQWFVQDYSTFFMEESAWFQRLLLDRHFVDLVVERYWELREGVLSDQYIYNMIEKGEEELGDAIDRNFAVWGYTFTETMMVSGGGEKRDPSSHDDAVTKLKDSINERFKFLDAHITDLYDKCVN